jgi:CDP-diacylglycerol--glycerol-3-phosphate 3-phosphatidyltransferase
MISFIKLENLPNMLSFFRFLAGIAILLLYYFEFFSKNFTDIVVFVIFIIAALTDWFDGLIARNYKLTSNFGAFIDPVADKVLIVCSLICLIYLDRVDLLLGSIIVLREFFVSSLREWFANNKKILSVSVFGKVKTLCQMISIPMFFIQEIISNNIFYYVADLLFHLAVMLTIYSMIVYSLEIRKI